MTRYPAHLHAAGPIKGLAATIVAATLLAGCGGAADNPAAEAGSGAPASASAARDAGTENAGLQSPSEEPVAHASRRRALAATVVGSTEEILFDWAERAYPSLFPGHPESQFASPYAYRFYPATGIYLGVWSSRIYLMGGPFGNQPLRVGPVASYWGQAVTKSPESNCWNLDLMFTNGTLVEVDWAQTGAGAKPLGKESLQTQGPAEWEGASVIQFWRMFQHIDAVGNQFGRQARVYMSRSGPDQVAWHAEVYMEASTIPFVGAYDMLNGTDVARPPRLDRHYSLAVGQSVNSSYTVSSQVNRVGATPTDIQTTHQRTQHSLTTRVVARESIAVPAGTYDTCRIEETDAADPGRRVTTWVAAGRGIPVQRVTVVNGVEVLTQRATALRVNQKRV